MQVQGRRVTRTPWALVLVVRRWRAQWRLQVALLLVAVTSSAALCALVPLVQATEPAAVRTALSALPAARTAIDVQVVRPGDAPEVLRRDIGAGLGRLLDSAAPPRSAVSALAQPLRTTAVDGGALVYAAAVDAPEDAAVLVSGAWPRAGSRDAAVPLSAARALGLRAGDRLPLTSDDERVPALRISGVYSPRLDAAFWQVDPLHGRGEDPQFVDPATAFGVPGEAFGPLLAARGALDGGDLPLLVVDLRFQPDLTGTPPSGLRATADRVADADAPVAAVVGAATQGIGVSSSAPAALRAAAGALDASRALVAVSGLLLAALTAAVLLVAARLLAVSRAGEQRVLAERGAGRRHVVGLAVAEAAGTGLLVALVAPVPALLLYALLVDGPGARAAAVPRLVGPSPALWAVAAGSGLVLAIVLAAAALRPPVRDRAGRASRVGAAARSGADLAVLAVAVVLLVRLLSVAGPPTGVALAAPVLLLVAGAVVGLRLVAVAGRALEPVAARTRSATGALAAFELGRRAQRSASAVLVVALGLGSGAFGLAQLATWERSQQDQAAFAVGAPVRAAAEGRGAVSPALVRADDPDAALALRTDGLLTGPPDSGTSLATVGVLAAPPGALQMLGRSEDAAARALRAGPATVASLDEPALPAGADRLRLEVGAASDTAPRPTGVEVAAVLRTRDGLVESPTATLDAGADAVSLALPATRPLRLAGLRFTLPADGATASSRLRIAAVSAGGVDLPAPQGWQQLEAPGGDPSLLEAESGFADVTARAAQGNPVVLELLAWPPVVAVPVVLDRAASRSALMGRGESAELVLEGAGVPVTIVGVVPRVAGAAPVREVASGGAVTRTSMLVADREQLQRALVEQGSSPELDGEWWLAPAGGGTAAALGASAVAVGAQDLRTTLLDGPLRIGIRPALLLLVGTAALLTLVAFGVQIAWARHDRRFDLAQLRAAGATRGELARLDAAVAAVLIALGALVGLPAGVLIAFWAGPRLVTGPDGGAPVPAVVFDPAPLPLAVLALGAAAVLLLVVVLSALAADRGTTARLIRLGGEP